MRDGKNNMRNICPERITVCSFNRLWDCPEEDSSNPGLGSIMSIVAGELE